MAKEIKNYLKSVKDITAPLNWKSSPDSPPTQLAYVTKPEIDMLVKANIHGSMNGKPNKGPKGIISLDGGGVEYFKDDKPVSFGDQAGVTIDVSTQEGQDKRQEFRDKTGSNVVTDAEKKLEKNKVGIQRIRLRHPEVLLLLVQKMMMKKKNKELLNFLKLHLKN